MFTNLYIPELEMLLFGITSCAPLYTGILCDEKEFCQHVLHIAIRCAF